jgi:hypothetical protein
VSDPFPKWGYSSPEEELETIRWYLVGRLDLQTKLDPRLSVGVNAYEYLRHAVHLPNLGRFLQVPMKSIGACEAIFPDPETGQWLKVPEFPKLPFPKLSLSSKEIVLEFLNAKYPAFNPVDIAELAYWGVLEELLELAKITKGSERIVPAEIEVFRQTSVIPFAVNFGAGVKEAERSVQHWIRENRHRFAKDGRSLAGARARNNPSGELKDLAIARLLYLNDFNIQEASKWARKSRPRDSDGRLIPWFNKRGGRGRWFSGPFKDQRDWTRALERFKKNLQAFLGSQ